MKWRNSLQKLQAPWVLIPVLLLLVLVLAAVWFFNTFEKKEYQFNRGVSPQARTNQLLALEKYLQATGHSAESREGIDLLTQLPQVSDAIVVRHMPGGLSKKVVDDLLYWVDAGGHLLFVPSSLQSDHPGNSDILTQLGARLEERKSDSGCGCPESDDEEADEESIADDTQNEPDDSQEGGVSESETSKDEEEEDEEEWVYRPSNTILKFDVDGHNIKLESSTPRLLINDDSSPTYIVDGSYYLEYENEEDMERTDHGEFSYERGAWLLQYTIGTGKITVLSEMYPFFNRQLGEYDHAFFLGWLTRDAEKIWLLYSTALDPFLVIIWEMMPYFWISLGILLLLILWRMQKRGGVLLRPELERNHNIMLHIDATAQFNWRNNKLDTVVSDNRKAIMGWWVSRKLGIKMHQDNKEETVGALAQRSGINEQLLYSAFTQKIETEQDLLRSSKALHLIRTLIQGGDKKHK